MPKQKRTNNIDQFAKEFTAMLSGFESAVESITGFIADSFDATRKESAAITELFAKSRTEAESIFSLFEAIAGIFSGKGSFFESLFGLLPGGNLFGTLLGSLAPALPNSALHTGQAVQALHIPAPVVVVNTQLERAGMYKVYREGKLVADTRPGR